MPTNKQTYQGLILRDGLCLLEDGLLEVVFFMSIHSKTVLIINYYHGVVN